MQRDTDISFLSANLKSVKDSVLLFPPYKIIERGNIKIGIIGVTNLLPDTMKAVIAEDYIEACNKYSEELSDEVEIVVALVNTDRSSQNQLSEKISNVDFIITSGSTNLTRESTSQKAEGPFLYSCGKQGKYLLSLDVALKDQSKPFIDISSEEKKIKSIQKRFDRLQKKDPEKPLKEIYADQKNVLNLIEKYQDDLKASENAISSAINTLKFQAFPLNKKVQDNEEMLSFVQKSVETCNALNPKKPPKKTYDRKSNKKEIDLHKGHNH